MAYHQIKQNQTLAELVAEVAPHLDVATVRAHEKNAQLFAVRDEYLLNPGDPVWIDEEPPKYKWNQVASGETLTLQVLEAPRKFKVTLIKPTREPLANQAAVLELGSKRYEGTTDADGVLELEVPFDATHGVLIVGKLRRKLQIGGLDPIHTIKGIQARLANMGFEPGTVDGIVGPKTTGAVEAFQAYRLLDESGVVDDETRKAILETYGC